MKRRAFIKSAAAAAAIIAFDPLTRRWARAGTDPWPGMAAIPPLDGELVTDDASRDGVSHDSGYLKFAKPKAVLRPGSVDDVVAMMAFCHHHRIPVAGRGQAHSVYGQPLVADGLVIDMSTLNTIHSIGAESALVDGGVQWSELLDAALEHGKTPPLFTGYIALSIGGTLSVGGVSTRPHGGVQVDRVKSLDVVTGKGQLVHCSATEEPELFGAVLAGFGQFGVIVRARIELVDAPARVRHWSLSYTDPRVFFADLRTQLHRRKAHHVWGQVFAPGSPTGQNPSGPAPLRNPTALGAVGMLLAPLVQILLELLTGPVGDLTAAAPRGNWQYQLNLAYEYDDPDALTDLGMLRGMNDVVALRSVADVSHRDFTYKIDGLVDVLKALGLWYDTRHPWIDNFLDGSEVEDFVVETMAGLGPDDVGAAGLVLLFPIHRSHLTRPSFALPSGPSDWVYLFDILTSAPGPGPQPEFEARMLARNRALYETARARGGTVYPISAVRMDPSDWEQQYGSTRYAQLKTLKHQHDPAGILTPGVTVF